MTDVFGAQTVRGARAADDVAVGGAHVLGQGAPDGVTGVGVPRLPTGIPGFDHVTMGGLPVGRTTVVVGPPGSAKTLFAGAFVAEGVRRGEAGVFVTIEEPAGDLRRNFATLGWDVAAWEEADAWRFVDASPVLDAESQTAQGYAVQTLLARIAQEVDRTAATRVVIDSLTMLFTDHPERAELRQLLRHLVLSLRRLGLSVLLTAETAEEADLGSGGFGVEEFLADNVVVLRNRLEAERRRRTVEVLKMRGGMHRKGEYPFTVLPGQGLIVIPMSSNALDQGSGEERISGGNAAFDAMCGGGLFRDSVVLVSGATGTGKTLMVTEFLSGGVAAGERSLLLAFEESRPQIVRNARGWGRDYEGAEAQGLLRIRAAYPEVASLEDHLVEIKNQVDAYQPARVAVDSLSALERIGSPTAFREFIIGLTSFLKQQRIAAMFTATTPTLVGGTSVTESHISTLTDAIVLLRYVEVPGDVRRAMTVLKMRGSLHDRSIRSFTITGDGMQIGEPFRDVVGVLAGRLSAAEGPTA